MSFICKSYYKVFDIIYKNHCFGTKKLLSRVDVWMKRVTIIVNNITTAHYYIERIDSNKFYCYYVED